MTTFIILTTIILLIVLCYMGINNLFYFNREYNNLINQLMDDQIPVTIRRSTCQFEGTNFDIWISNYPYAYGTTYPNEGGTLSMKTRRRLSNYIITNQK